MVELDRLKFESLLHAAGTRRGEPRFADCGIYPRISGSIFGNYTRSGRSSESGPRRNCMRRRCGAYEFPEGPWVLFFNVPFGIAVQEKVVENLKKASGEKGGVI